MTMSLIEAAGAPPARRRRSTVGNEDTDKHLREFLDWTKARAERDEETARKAEQASVEFRAATRELKKVGEKVEAVRETTQRLFNRFELHEQKDEERHKELKNDYLGLASRVQRLEVDAENTGKHNIEELQRRLREKEEREQKLADKALERREENRTWWQRHWVAVVTGIAASLVVGALSTGCTWLVMRAATSAAQSLKH